MSSHKADERCFPIGVFDSGLGGLTVLKEIQNLLPGESTVYFGDNGRAPYGTKSRETIISFAKQDAEFLLSMGVKMIVIACNTVSSYAYEVLCNINSIPIVEVITPGSKAALRETKNNRIGIIGTAATVNSGVYEKSILHLAKSRNITPLPKVFSRACPLFVSLVEEGWWEDEITSLTAEKYLHNLREKDVDTLILGCTHYPIIKSIIGKTMGENVTLVDSAVEVAKTVFNILEKNNLLNPAADISDIPDILYIPNQSHRYFTSDSEEKFKLLGSAFLGKEIPSVTKIDIEKYKGKG